MNPPSARLAVIALFAASLSPGCASTVAEQREQHRLTTIAIRVHDLDAMLSFYRAAFGAEFRPVMTGPIQSQFAEVSGITLKFVPIRESKDFDGYPSHQLGFEVPDVPSIIELAQTSGGRQEGTLRHAQGSVHGAIRDPDGNTIELYSKRK